MLRHKKHGCRVVGIDLSARMVDWSQKRAERHGVEDHVEFMVADAQNLPFADGHFDAVICESVNAFIPAKREAAKEYRRVTRSGGHVGLNECTWIKPPPSALLDYVSHVFGNVEFLTSAGWTALLEDSGLDVMEGSARKISAISQWYEEIKQLDFQDYLERIAAFPKFLSGYVRSSAFRRYVHRMLWPLPLNLFEYLGYGLYIGRK